MELNHLVQDTKDVIEASKEEITFEVNFDVTIKKKYLLVADSGEIAQQTAQKELKYDASNWGAQIVKINSTKTQEL